MAMTRLIMGVLPALPVAEQQALVLLQNRAQMQKSDDLGSTAPLTEEGYQEVAALKSNKEMKAFAHRLLNSEARYVSNAGELTGLIHWYSGRMGAQDLEALKRELRQAWWTKPGEGRTAPLNERGYRAVVAMNSNAHLRAYMRRILNSAGKKVTDAGAFDAMVEMESDDHQSFDELRERLVTSEWVADKDNAVAENIEDLASEVVDNTSDEMLMQELPADEKESVGATAPLSQEGYEQVAALVNNKEMKKFAHRILQNDARYATNIGSLTGAIHWYSGRRDTQDFESLRAELRRAWWTRAGEGYHAPLNEKGYAAVAAMKSNAHMLAFMRRILNAANKEVTDVDAFYAVAPYYDGENSIEGQSFEKLQAELLSAPWVVDKDASVEQLMRLPDEAVQEILMHDALKQEQLELNPEGSCLDWCGNEMFAKIEENSTVAKNLSSWEMKCSWYYCGDCSPCKDPSLRVIERRDRTKQPKKVFDKKDASCEDWCSSEDFMYVHHNSTVTGHFSWEMKCGWQYCAACKKCEDR